MHQQHKSPHFLWRPKPKLLDVEELVTSIRRCLIRYDSRLCTAPNVLPYVQHGRLVLSKRQTGQTADISNVMPMVCVDMQVLHLHNPQEKTTAPACYVYIPDTIQCQNTSIHGHAPMILVSTAKAPVSFAVLNCHMLLSFLLYDDM